VRVALELLPSFPFAPPSAVRTLRFPQGSIDTFPAPLFEMYTPVHGVYTMFGTHLIGIVKKRFALSLYVLVVGAGVYTFLGAQRPAPYATTSL